jgi:hypothetical protein
MKLTLIVQDFEAEALVSVLGNSQNAICEDFARIIEAKVERHKRRGMFSHNERVRIYENNRYHKRREAHQCVYCGVDLPEEETRNKCDKCREYGNTYARERNKRIMLDKIMKERQK